MSAVGQQSDPDPATGVMLQSCHKGNGLDLLFWVDWFFSQKTSCREYKLGSSRSCETGGGAAPACSCCTDSHTKCTLLNYCVPPRLQWDACYKFVTLDQSWPKIATFDCLTLRPVLSQLHEKNFKEDRTSRNSQNYAESPAELILLRG